MNLQKKNILVAGSGISGMAACRLLIRHGIATYIYDENKNLTKEMVEQKFPKEETIKDVFIGSIPENIKESIDVIVLSPGIPVDSGFVLEFVEKGIPIIGEIELAYLLGKGTVIGITGTNGKTTTTALTGAIMKEYFKSVFVVGNIGTPYTGVVDEMNEQTVTVAEISSFQLETTHEFHPHVTAILNITPDHLNRHHTIENYIQTKCSITKAQTKADVCVLNYDNEITRKLAEHIPAEPFFFSRLQRLTEGICLDGDNIVLCHKGEQNIVCRVSELQLPGNHNIENVMAAIAIAVSMKVPLDSVRHSVIHFTSVEHRIEYVAEKGGVIYYNDSKGTNTDAAIKGIEAMTRPTVLLAGGYDKNAEYDEWIQSCKNKVKCLVLIGETKYKIAETAKKYGIKPVIFAETFQEAMDICVREAVSGDAVLLSPACASWGMFKNYEQRGEMFKEYVTTKIL